MLTVACVKWGDKYGPAYVTKLQSMCKRHLPKHRFVCFTENPVEGVDCHPLPSGLPGWWSKVALFKPSLFTGDVLYFDLDVVITGNLTEMVEECRTDLGTLWAPDDFSYSLVNPKRGLDQHTLRLLGGHGTINSSVMFWHGDYCADIWKRFSPSVMDVLHGDQNWITQVMYPDIQFIGKEWVSSYKYGGPGVVKVFHGDPKPAAVKEAWVAKHWC